MATAETSGFQLRYFKTSGQGFEDESKFYHGIFVMKLEGEEVLEQADSGFITEDAEQAIALITCLAENTVTPMALCEVLDEICPVFS